MSACGRGANELNGERGVAAYGLPSPDPSYRHSTLSFADRAPVIGVPKAHYTVPSLCVGCRAVEAGVPGQRLQPPHSNGEVLQVLSVGGIMMVWDLGPSTRVAYLRVARGSGILAACLRAPRHAGMSAHDNSHAHTFFRSNDAHSMRGWPAAQRPAKPPETRARAAQAA